MQKEIGGDGYTISIYVGDTEEWKEAKVNLGEKKQELGRQIKLSLGHWELREKLNNFEGDKIWKANGGERRKESVGDQLPTIGEEEEIETISGR